MSELQRVEIRSVEELRGWLATQTIGSPTVWLVHYKKHVSDKYVSWPDLVRTCLCFGWIDGQSKRVDDDRVMHRISPRRAGSHWSAINKRLVVELEASGELTDAGRAVIARAKADGSWSFLDDIEALVTPPDLQAALDADNAAAQTWASYPKSEKKQALYQLKSAKRPATRSRRLDKILTNAAAGRRSFT